uniref:Uncharacterized protein n=1 Tax=Esox lucius TaxID=8010 RepID=A0AAY5KJ19_ESOLU
VMENPALSPHSTTLPWLQEAGQCPGSLPLFRQHCAGHTLTQRTKKKKGPGPGDLHTEAPSPDPRITHTLSWLQQPVNCPGSGPPYRQHSDPEDQKKRGQGQVTSIQRHPVLTPALHTLSPGYSSLSTALALVPHTGNTLTQRTKRKGGQGLEWRKPPSVPDKRLDRGVTFSRSQRVSCSATYETLTQNQVVYK